MKQKRKDALQELLAKVEAGNCSNNGIMFGVFGDEWIKCFDAYNGSLDAALALHGTVLPGWQYGYDGIIAWVKMPGMRKRYSCADPNGPAAHAWLCAILQALVAECEV